MFSMTQNASKRIGIGGLVSASIVFAMTVSAVEVKAQEAIGVPFVGNNHLAFYTTELSRDGIGQEKAAVFGAVYGRRFGDRQGDGEVSVLLRAGARAFEDLDDGILDTGATLAATRSIPTLERLSVTGSAGMGVVAWGQGPDANAGNETGRLSLRVPMSAGIAYDLRVGGATIAPFAAVTTTYSSERDYVGDERTAIDGGWRLGSSMGVSLRFKETVLSLSGIRRERGMPHQNRVVFSAGMSW